MDVRKHRWHTNPKSVVFTVGCNRLANCSMAPQFFSGMLRQYRPLQPLDRAVKHFFSDFKLTTNHPGYLSLPQGSCWECSLVFFRSFLNIHIFLSAFFTLISPQPVRSCNFLKNSREYIFSVHDVTQWWMQLMTAI